MSLRPADLGGVIGQTTNVEKVSINVAQQARTHQDVVAQQQQQQADAAANQVQGTPHAEGNTIRGDGDGGGGGAGGGGGRRRRAPESAESTQEEGKSVKPRQRRSARIDFRA